MGLNHIGMRQLQSEAYTLRLMRKIHGAHPYVDGSQTGVFYKAAQNVASYARQAIAYAKAADAASIEVVPVVRYYQMLHTIKTLLYLFSLDFPSSTSVLQHGLSVRRIKRNGYRWPLEKLTVHKEGIIQSFHQLLSPNPLPDRILVGDLLGSLPQLAGILSQFYDHLEHAYPLYVPSSSFATAARVDSPSQPNSPVGSPMLHGAMTQSVAKGYVVNPSMNASKNKNASKHTPRNVGLTKSMNKSTGESVHRSISESMGESARESAGESLSETLSDSISDSTGESTGESENVNVEFASELGVNSNSEFSSVYNSDFGFEHNLAANPEFKKCWVSRRIASNQGLTIHEWKKSYLKAGGFEDQDQTRGDNQFYTDRDVKGYLEIPAPKADHPWFNSYDGINYLIDDPVYPVYLVHYGLLYGLSALSRYSATEWSDIVHWNNEQDALLVREFLRLPFPRPLIQIHDLITPQSIQWVASGQIIGN